MSLSDTLKRLSGIEGLFLLIKNKPFTYRQLETLKEA
jgi:hypothetical protein